MRKLLTVLLLTASCLAEDTPAPKPPVLTDAQQKTALSMALKITTAKSAKDSADKEFEQLQRDFVARSKEMCGSEATLDIRQADNGDLEPFCKANEAKK